MSLTLIHGWRDLEPQQKGASVALGAFDGVHRGHRQVIAEAARHAQALKVPLGVIRFSPHPVRMIRPDLAPFMLMSPAQNARALADLGVDLLYELAFDAEMAGLSDADFVRDVLARGLGVRHLSAGFDITFGRGRSGTAEGLRAFGAEHGFGVSIVERVAETDGHKVSSSDARQAVRDGDMERAAQILGRPFAIEGVVVQGRQLGRTLGFPTANIMLGDYVRPRLGVYATRTRLPDGRVLPGVASVGANPTVGVIDPQLEVWLFDFDEDLYGQTLETELVHFQRPEEKFDGLEALTAQVMKDAAQARALLMPAF
jgi:riboflavin kinase/FMN adenylyltransferase